MKRDNDETMAHVENNDAKKTQNEFSYDPKDLQPSESRASQPANLDEESVEDRPLEHDEPDKGYSTNPKQSITGSSLHLADEDMDVSNDDPVEKAKEMEESFEMYKKEE